jgi:hypothetical protein
MKRVKEIGTMKLKITTKVGEEIMSRIVDFQRYQIYDRVVVKSDGTDGYIMGVKGNWGMLITYELSHKPSEEFLEDELESY